MNRLADIKPGDTVAIYEIEDPDALSQLLRMGISPGGIVVCLAKVPSGPTVIKHGGMELAIGEALSQQIMVQPV